MSRGLALSRNFYAQEIAPLLRRHFPDLAYAAGLIGYGSEVLGYNSARSQDHHWGPRALLFLRDADLAAYKDRIASCLSDNLPYEFEGFSTNFGSPDGIGVRLPAPIASGPVRHMVEFYSVRGFAQWRLGIDAAQTISNLQWLTLTQQRLLETTSGEIFHDGVGEVTALRGKLTYFPRDVWLYLLASQWQKISQEESFVGRADEAGDTLGSRLVAARLVRELMRLCFLMEKRYWPYTKWFGTAFAQLKIAPAVAPHFNAVLRAADYTEREAALCGAYETVAARHNALGVTDALDPAVRLYYGRPFRVIRADRFAQAIHARIEDPRLQALKPFGSVDQFVDNTDVLESPTSVGALGALYGG